MTANKFKAEVSAPEFGAGYTIRIDIDGQAQLETEHGDPERIGLFLVKVQYGLAALSSKYLKSFLLVALRDPSGAVVKELPEFTGPLDVIGKHCLNSLALFRYGKDHEAWAAEQDARKAEAGPAENPTKGTEA